jgi:hypothetical protein
MANNRMYLCCTVCEKIPSRNPYVCIGKRYAGGWYMLPWDSIERGLETHEACTNGTWENAIFTLTYETAMTPEQWNKVNATYTNSEPAA